jgi:predicted DNA-binding transcriptional regulator AlpA
MEKYLTEQEVSKLTGLALSSLRNDRAYARKLFPYVKIGRSVRYRESDVIEAMERRKIGLAK